jgi:hypothetical protein
VTFIRNSLGQHFNATAGFVEHHYRSENLCDVGADNDSMNPISDRSSIDRFEYARDH